MTIMPTTAKATKSGYSKRSRSRRVIYSSDISKTAAADNRIVTFAKRENASSTNIPPKATDVPSPDVAIHAAMPTNTIDVIQSDKRAMASLPV